MAWTTPETAVAGQVLTAAYLNTNVRDNTSFLFSPPMVKASRLTTQSIANVTDTFATWTTQDIDTDNMFAPTSDTITINTTGVYLCQAQVVFASNGTGNRFVHIVKNDDATPSFTLNIATGFLPGNATNNLIVSCSTIAALTATDTLKVIVFQGSGGALNIGDTNVQSFFSAAWIGRIS